MKKCTSRIAHVCLGSSSFILPFGKPHPDDDFQPLTNTHYGDEVGVDTPEEMTCLIPRFIEHDCTAHRNLGLVLHECTEGLLMIVVLVKEGACLEQHGGKPLERESWELGIFLADKVFIEPVAVGSEDKDISIDCITDACSI